MTSVLDQLQVFKFVELALLSFLPFFSDWPAVFRRKAVALSGGSPVF